MRDANKQYMENLEHFFHDYATIEGWSLQDGIKAQLDGDLLVMADPTTTLFVRPHLLKDIPLVYLSRTFVFENAKKLMELPRGTKVLLVDYSYNTCMKVISALYEIGIKHIDFFPCYFGMAEDDIPAYDIAATPGLLSYVPAGVETVIDIGWTVVDSSTVMEIAVKLNIFDDIIEERLVRYSDKITPIQSQQRYALEHSGKLKTLLDTMLNVINDGVIVFDNDLNILFNNKQFVKMINPRNKDLPLETGEGGPFRDLLERITAADLLEDVLIKLPQHNKGFVVTKKPLTVHNTQCGHVVIIKDVSAIQDLENNLRKQLANKGLVAKYRFEDIVGQSKLMAECISRAKKIARIETNVLITGESGTGKELFAQSIHNTSGRRNKPFVAINCAALPPTLLESELFGYEDGAFTNARKGGKKGLFELAHEGTLFLDEIGDLPISTQVKLLRVLQEKEVMRIGATSILPVNVKVIAATNLNLRELVQKGEFRKDLYYRLNTLTLHLPALRERRGDIPFLIEDVLGEIGCGHKRLEERAMSLLYNYPWDGNVRELKGCIEYMAYMGGDLLTSDDFPPDLQIGMTEKKEGDLCFTGLLPYEKKIAVAILKDLKIRSVGRRFLYSLLVSQGIETSEHEVRRILDILVKMQLVEFGKGRTGTKITDKGQLICL